MQDRQGWTGILLVDKPRGQTSFAMVGLVRRITGIRRVGHIGTLDPFAEGLLPVCVGRATAAVQFMESYDKTYEVLIRFGTATDTQDLTGTVIDSHVLQADERQKLLETDFAVIREAVAGLHGTSQQLPPMYSAVKKDGRPLYDYARKGETVDRQTRAIEIHKIEILSLDIKEHVEMTLTVSCSKGTYIRTLADTLGRDLGYFAHAAALRRTVCGPFLLDNAQTADLLATQFEQIEDAAALQDRLAQAGCLLPVSAAFSGWPSINLPIEEARKLVSGQPVLISQPEPDDGQETETKYYAVYYQARLIAAARLKPADQQTYRIKTERVFVDRADIS